LPTKGQKLKHYSGEFKKSVVLDVLENGLGLRETARNYGVTHKMVTYWIKIYLQKGVDSLYHPYAKKHSSGANSQNVEHSKENDKPSVQSVMRPKQSVKIENSSYPERGLPKEVAAELKRLRMENTYLKKLNALVQGKKKF
jgi:transposase